MSFEESIETIVRRVVREEVRTVVAELRAPTASPASSTTLLTVEDVAARVGGVTPETVRAWIHSGALVARKAGHRYVVGPADLERFLAGREERKSLPADQHLRLLMGRAMGGK